MQVPREVVEEVRREENPPPHIITVKNIPTSYTDLQKREVVLAEAQLNIVEWVYRHEVKHLSEWPRTIGKMLYHEAKIAASLPPYLREVFKKYRREAMNIVYDSVIDYELAKKSPAARKHIAEYAEKALRHLDPPPCDLARAVAVGLIKGRVYSEIVKVLKKRDLETLGYWTALWLERNRPTGVPLDLAGEPSPEDFEEAYSELVREGEPEAADYLKEVAEEEGVRFSEDRAALRALVKAYDWYLEHEKKQSSFRRAAARLDRWVPGDSPSKLDYYASLSQSPLLVPGLTTVKRDSRRLEGLEEPFSYKAVAIVLDDSGSMGYLYKAKAARKAAVSILALLNRKRVPFQLIFFGVRAKTVARGFDYVKAVKALLRYYPNQNDTRLAPALELLQGKDLLVYIITDAEIHDYAEVANYRGRIKEVVLVIINQGTEKLEEFTQALGVPTVVYHLPPSKADEWAVREIRRIVK